MIYHLYLSVLAIAVCCCVLGILKMFSISKMRLDNRDKKRKVQLTTLEILALLRNIKPFPVGPYKGWKLHSYQNSSRVWCQRINPNNNEEGLTIYSVYRRVFIPAQAVLQILKDVSRTTSWKPGVLATSITSKPTTTDVGKSMMGGTPVQHDIISEETSLHLPPHFAHRLVQFLTSLIGQNSTALSLTKEHNRYWHREDNGVCWMLQMSEHDQEWLFFLAQPVEALDQSVVTVMGYIGKEMYHSETAKHVSAILGSLHEYIRYRKMQSTPLIDIKLPSSRWERHRGSHSSSDEVFIPAEQILQKRQIGRYQSLIERPTYISESSVPGVKRELVRSVTILQHRTKPSSSIFTRSQLSKVSKQQSQNGSVMSQSGNTSSIQVKNMGDNSNEKTGADTDSLQGEVTLSGQGCLDNNNIVKPTDDEEEIDSLSEHSEDNLENSDNLGNSDNLEHSDVGKDIDRSLEEDFNFQKTIEKLSTQSGQLEKKDVRIIISANQTAAELLSVGLQASAIDLQKSPEDQVTQSGGWIFCGLNHDVVILKKISIKDTIVSFLGKGIIEAPPQTVWDAIRNPRTRFAYDESLKKVDVLEVISDRIKIVYYFHEVLQLFKRECCDMVVCQSEKVDGEKHILAMQSVDRTVNTAENVLRIKVLPSGWIIEPITKDKKCFSMATYIMQVDLGNIRPGFDKTPFEELIAKQPMSIANLRQYLSPGALWANKSSTL